MTVKKSIEYLYQVISTFHIFEKKIFKLLSNGRILESRHSLKDSNIQVISSLYFPLRNSVQKVRDICPYVYI